MPAKTGEVPTQEQRAQSAIATLTARVNILEERLVQVEEMLQSGQVLEPGVVRHIAGVAMEQVKTDVLTQLGMSGFPARGDA